MQRDEVGRELSSDLPDEARGDRGGRQMFTESTAVTACSWARMSPEKAAGVPRWMIGAHFLPTIEAALGGQLEAWSSTRGRLALIIVLDKLINSTNRERLLSQLKLWDENASLISYKPSPSLAVVATARSRARGPPLRPRTEKEIVELAMSPPPAGQSRDSAHRRGSRSDVCVPSPGPSGWAIAPPPSASTRWPCASTRASANISELCWTRMSATTKRDPPRPKRVPSDDSWTSRSGTETSTEEA
jgi:hypothetical protein